MKTRPTKMNCYNCNALVDAHTEVDETGSVPKNGDISICFYCGALAEFMDTKLIPLSAEKRANLILEEPELWQDILELQKQIKEARKRYKDGRENLNTSHPDGTMENNPTGTQCQV